MKIIITEVNGDRKWELNGSLPSSLSKSDRAIFFNGLQQFYFQHYEVVVNIEIQKQPVNSFVVLGIENKIVHAISLERMVIGMAFVDEEGEVAFIRSISKGEKVDSGWLHKFTAVSEAGAVVVFPDRSYELFTPEKVKL
jgi:hypothetical protein